MGKQGIKNLLECEQIRVKGVGKPNGEDTTGDNYHVIAKHHRGSLFSHPELGGPGGHGVPFQGTAINLSQ